MRVAVLVVTVLFLHGTLSLAATLQEALQYAGWICRDPEMREKFYNDGPCTCGPSCALYGDCCQDSEYLVQEEQLLGKSLASCVPVNDELYFHVITSCPSYWEHNDTRSRCEHPDKSYPNPLLDVPVTSRRTSITYYNAHCAICHGDFYPRVDVQWPFRFNCEWAETAVKDRKYASVKIVGNCTGKLRMEDTIVNLTVKELLNESFMYSYDDYFYKILNTTNITYPSSSSECFKYDNNKLQWHINLTCAFYIFNRKFIENRYARELNKIGTTKNSDRVCHIGNPAGRCDRDDIDDHTDTGSNISLTPYGNIDLPENRKHPSCFKKYLLIPTGIEKCWVEILQPHGEGIYLKHCRYNRIETCAADWTDLHIKEKCALFTYPLCLKYKLFRNVFCAYCNYADSFKHTFCDDGDVLAGTPESFSLLVDWSSRNSRCKNMEVYDPVKYTCININPYATGVRSARFNSTDTKEAEVGIGPNIYVTFIGLSVSMTCLVLHLIIFMLTPKLRNLASMNVASLCVALLLLYSSFISISFADPPCAELAIILHYSLLAMFTWMVVISFDVWKTIRSSVNEIRVFSGPQWKRFSVYSAFCWIVPVIILTPALIVEFFAPDSDFRSYYGVTNCWIQNRNALLVFVVAPLSIVMILNVVFFSWSSYLVYTTKSQIAKTSNERKDVSLFLRMAIIMGLTWTTGLVAGLVQYAGVWYVFIVLNTLQGLFIFIAFSCRKKMLKEVLGERHCFLCADT